MLKIQKINVYTNEDFSIEIEEVISIEDASKIQYYGVMYVPQKMRVRLKDIQNVADAFIKFAAYVKEVEKKFEEYEKKMRQPQLEIARVMPPENQGLIIG